MDSADDDLIGTVVDGRYRVVRRLGHGGMGAVYEVDHERIGRRFALKTLHAELAKNPEMVARFHREARAAGAIGNEHIVEVSDMGRLPDGEPYIVMELLDGKDLGEVLEASGPLPVARVVHIVTQACEGLQAAHSAGIIHRDLKPENLFLVTGRKSADFVKLLDFGISKFREVLEGLDGAPATRTGMTMGTPWYMAPEQAMAAKDIDGRADVYAMGVVLFQMLTGRLPFDAPSLPALMIEIMQADPPSIVAVRRDVPRALEAVVHRAMEKQPEDRFSSMAELAAALEPFAGIDVEPDVATHVDPFGTTHTPKTIAATRRDPPASRGGRGPLFAAIGVVGLIVIVGVGAFATGGGFGGGEDAAPAQAESPSRPMPPEPPVTATPDETAAAALEAEVAQTPPPSEPPVPTPEASPVAGTVGEPPAPTARRRRGRTPAAAEPVAAAEEPSPPPPAAETRAISATNERRAEVEVVLACGSETRTARVAPGARVSIRAPATDCRVTCNGLGGPRCPLVLRVTQNGLVIR